MTEPTDLEIVRACAEAMGYVEPMYKRGDDHLLVDSMTHKPGETHKWIPFDPLHDDAQALTLVKKFRLHINDMQDGNDRAWGVFHKAGGGLGVYGRDLLRAICLCVFNMKGRDNAE